MKQPLVSIVTVTYNAEEFIEQTIKSIIEQDYKNIEYIIIDGNSTDGTVDIIKKYEKHISYWISEPDSGIYDAMNKGIDKATGDWIVFMNAGDSFCDRDTIERVIKNLASDVDLVSGDMYYINGDEKVYLNSNRACNPFDGMFCFHQTLFTKTALMKKYMFNTTFKIAGDYDFVLRCFTNKHRFQFLDFAIANFLAGGLSEKNQILAKTENVFIQTRYLKDSKEVLEHLSFKFLEAKKKRQKKNLHFSSLLNKLYTECNKLMLSEKKFVLYGYGTIGEIIFSKYHKNIQLIIDQNYTKIKHKNNIQISNPDRLKKIEFDYIFISVLGREEEIKNFLAQEYNIENSKILEVIL